MLPPGAVPTAEDVPPPGNMPASSVLEAAVPFVSVGWESVLPVVERVPEVVISSLCVVVLCMEVVGVVMGAVVFLFLFLPQAQSAHDMARTKNIARIFFIIFSLFCCSEVKI